jgi:hypothetical protein
LEWNNGFQLAGEIAISDIETLPELNTKYTLDFFASAAPEPDTWAMFILGFGITGGVLRFQRRRIFGELPTGYDGATGPAIDAI